MPVSDQKQSASGEAPKADPVGGTRHAISSVAAVVIFLSVAVVSLAGDLLSKEYVFKSLLNDPDSLRQLDELVEYVGPGLPAEKVLHQRIFQRRIIPGMQFTLSTNPGVVFGLPMPRWAVATATIITMGLVVLFFATSEARVRSVHVALAMILAGALGNLYDRLFSEVVIPGVGTISHQVRDFIDCGELYYPYIFNIADVLLVVGVGVLMLQWWILGRRAKDE